MILEELEQMERHAYADGKLREAALLRAVIGLYDLGDADAAQDEVIQKLWGELRTTS